MAGFSFVNIIFTIAFSFFLVSFSNIDAKAANVEISHGYSISAEGAKAVLKVAYQRLGVDVTFSQLPRKRALKLSVEGQKDGEVMRRMSVAEDNPTLLAVQTPVIFSQIVAYHRENTNFEMEDLADLSQFKVIRSRGTVSHKIIADQAASQIVVADYEQGFSLLRDGRADILIGTGLVPVHLLEDDGETGRILAKTVQVEPLYHMLHVRNSDLVPQLEAIMEDMDKSGEREALFQARVNEILQSTNVN